jgi:hypothetical protein
VLREGQKEKMDYKGEAAVLLSAFVVVGMLFLVPTEKALAINIAKVEGTCAGQPCEFTFMNRGLSAGEWFVPGGDPTGCCSPSTGPHQSPMKWTTRGSAPASNEEGYVVYQVGQHKEYSRINAGFVEEGASPEAGYQAKLFFHNPLFGRNTCSVEIRNPAGQLQEAGKGPVTGSCNAGQGNPATVTYTLKSEYQ